MTKARRIEAKFLATDFTPTGENRTVWARNIRQRHPEYEDGKVVVYMMRVSTQPLEVVREGFQIHADMNKWELVEVTEL